VSALAPTLLLGLAAFLAYARTLGFDLVWDDPLLLQAIREKLQAGGVPRLLTAEFEFRSALALGFYRPLSLLSLWLDLLAGAGRPWVFHATNVLLHMAATLLTARLVARVAGSARAGFLGGLVFALHPIHSESVAFVSGRTDLLAGVFSLVAALAWLRNREHDAAHPTRDLAIGLAAFAAATLAKEVAFLLPAVLISWDAIVAGAQARVGWWRRNRPWLLGWSAVLVGVVALRFLVAGVGFGKVAATVGGPGVSSGIGPALSLTYLRLLALPWPLSAYYLPSDVGVGALTLLGALIAALWVVAAQQQGRRVGALGLLWVAGFLVPVLGFVPFTGAVLAERYLYLPSVGFALMAGSALQWLWDSRPWRPLAVSLSLSLLALFALGTVVRTAVWSNALTLYADIVKTSPSYAAGHYNLGNAYQRLGRYTDAGKSYQRALQLRPGDPPSLNNLASVLRALGRDREALPLYREAVRLQPDYVDAQLNLGKTALALGDRVTAERAHRSLLQLGAPAATELGALLR
jgi:tetratricopeptide (TPR) repeat protein